MGRIKCSDSLKCHRGRMLYEIYRVIHEPVDLGFKASKQAFMALFQPHCIIARSLQASDVSWKDTHLGTGSCHRTPISLWLVQEVGCKVVGR